MIYYEPDVRVTSPIVIIATLLITFCHTQFYLSHFVINSVSFCNASNTHCVSGGKKCSFFGKFGVLCFLETPVLRFTLLPYYRRTVCMK